MSTVTGTFKQIREQRAQGLVEDVELEYKRRIEDLCREIKQYDRSSDSLPDRIPPLHDLPDGRHRF